ncbi:hypothetical protein RCL1_003087 [Eukaryota sp. TZLM3-RCL]
MLSASSFVPGDIITASKASVFSLRNAFLNKCCSHCFKLRPASEDTEACSREYFCSSCHFNFCSKDCFDAAIYHKELECQVLVSFQSYEETVDTELFRLIIRACHLFENDSESLTKILALPVYPDFCQLDQSLLDHYQAVGKAVSRFVPSISVSTVSILCHVINCNAFGVQDDQCMGLFDPGVALFPDFSNLEHSCYPNAILAAVPGKVLQLRALTEIKEGDQITVSKLSTLYMPTSERKSELESMGIDCKCDRCTSEEWLKIDEMLHGMTCHCGGLLKVVDDLLVCDACKNNTDGEVVAEVSTKVVQFIHTANTLIRRKEYEGAKQALENIFKFYSKYLTSEHQNSPLIRLPLMSCCFNLRQYGEAIQHGVKAIEILKVSFPPNHPKLAEAYHVLALVYKAKAHYCSQDPSKKSMEELSRKQSQLYFSKAHDIRCISLGPDHFITLESKQYLD